ncbi:MAG TPA: sigma-54 dependent transcriptional regulator [Myxococcales bacterium]|jgi:two-component system response regulator AtoC|nr:sigma-54 dependent transcriptional regulator [Myxococcales bacterium]
MSRGSVLVVDDDVAVARVMGALLEQAGLKADLASSGERALEILAERPFDVVVTDQAMPGMDGLELLTRVHERWPEIPVVMVTAHGTVQLAVEAMKRGAADFMVKPVDREQLLFVVQKELHKSARDLPATTDPAARSVGSSAAMQEVHALVKRAAPGTATVLIRGESGTGKELIARDIHDQSPRSKGPFVKLHCAALPDTLLESELFGYEKGAFTGAAARKPGRVELAQGGTLFLDEIGDVTPAVQVKLLRLLQEKEFERLGSTQTLKADVRFVAATHRPLEQMVKAGQFREDLFYRLAVVPILLPTLRARPEDVEPLARHFCEVHGEANGRKGIQMEPEAIAVLRAQSWPGNVRQLQNFVERLVVLSDGLTIGARDVERELARQVAPAISGADLAAPAAGALPGAPGAASAAAEPGTPTLEGQRKQAEKQALQAALAQAKDNRTLAAKLLGISRRTLYNKLEEFGLL